jgi:hypothetical protein
MQLALGLILSAEIGLSLGFIGGGGRNYNAVF